MIRLQWLRPTKPLACAFMLLCAVFATNASAQIGEAAAESLMKKSGLWRQVEGVGEQMGQGLSQALQQSDAKLPEETRALMAAAAAKAMSTERLRRDIRNELMVSIRAGDLPALEKWLDGSIGKRLTAIEENISKVDLAKLIEEGQLAWSKADPARRKALQGFIASARLVEAMSDMSVNMSSAIAFGAMSAVPGPSAGSFADVRALVESQRDEMTKSMRPMVEAISAAAYAKVSNADLAAYSAFMKGDAGARYMVATTAAMDKAMVRAAIDIGQAIVESMSTVKS